MTPETPNTSPEHYPSYRPPSRRQNPRFADPARKHAAAQAFADGAENYDAIRPGYPGFITSLAAGSVALDIGAGTGKLTRALDFDTVYACDPSADMVRVLKTHGISCWRAKAEQLALADASVDIAFCAQAWHWVDAQSAYAELDRVIRPGGSVVLVWNTIDVHSDPWVLRLTRIMHSGDIQRPDFRPEVHAPWTIRDVRHDYWEQAMQVEQLHTLMHSRSYWLRAKEKTREKMTGNLNWYLYDHMGFQPGEMIKLPYRTDAFVVTRYAG
ncbi:class I SAM-dependent methyltransferase [Corynebacterium sp. L4756]|uniref:class I SAM-dependent methyltransferase n=1 Tax=unclassified Corynebacterium TaxID=2624378 RepID=UPI00374D71B9